MKFELILTGWDLLVALGWQIGTMLIEEDTNLGASLFNVSEECKLKKELNLPVFQSSSVVGISGEKRGCGIQ